MFVESMIAAAIVAMALAATFRVLADSAARDRGVEARRAALMLAQSELADVGSNIPLAPGRTAGLSGDLVWRVAINPYAEGDAPNPAGELLWVTVSIEPRAGGPVLASLRTLRLGPGS